MRHKRNFPRISVLIQLATAAGLSRRRENDEGQFGWLNAASFPCSVVTLLDLSSSSCTSIVLLSKSTKLTTGVGGKSVQCFQPAGDCELRSNEWKVNVLRPQATQNVWSCSEDSDRNVRSHSQNRFSHLIKRRSPLHSLTPPARKIASSYRNTTKPIDAFSRFQSIF